MTKQIDVQDRVNDLVRDLSRAGHSDEEIIAMLKDSIMAALKAPVGQALDGRHPGRAAAGVS